MVVLLLAATTAACGAAQAIHDGSIHVVHKVVGTPMTSLGIDIINQVGQPSASAVVRVYQLKTSRSFLALSDSQWLAADLNQLHHDLLASDNLVLPAGAGGSLHLAIQPETDYLGVVAQVGDPQSKPLRLLIARQQWPHRHPLRLDFDRGGIQSDSDQ